jgi:hypothetical protein
MHIRQPNGSQGRAEHRGFCHLEALALVGLSVAAGGRSRVDVHRKIACSRQALRCRAALTQAGTILA